ncbi:hypothetical protein AB4865_03215 [Capnocytophaga sp. ARDL2]|uniref:hypothetical protein n=1 Tax=Capnocytophaga sp. ARDL2 TaxID=3238809 RepID=UPI003557A24D
MKNKWFLLFILQLINSLVTAVFLSQAKYVDASYRFIYEYTSDWKQGFFLCLAILSLLVLFLIVAKRWLKSSTFYIINLLLIIFSLVGLLFSFKEFDAQASNYLNEYFKYGIYVFWGTWIFDCLVLFLFKVKYNQMVENQSSEIEIISK